MCLVHEMHGNPDAQHGHRENRKRAKKGNGDQQHQDPRLRERAQRLKPDHQNRDLLHTAGPAKPASSPCDGHDRQDQRRGLQRHDDHGAAHDTRSVRRHQLDQCIDEPVQHNNQGKRRCDRLCPKAHGQQQLGNPAGVGHALQRQGQKTVQCHAASSAARAARNPLIQNHKNAPNHNAPTSVSSSPTPMNPSTNPFKSARGDDASNAQKSASRAA